MKDFNAVIDLKKRSRRSWLNLQNAAYKELGLPYKFGTKNVETSSVSYLNTSEKESEMSASEILMEIDLRKLV